MNRCLLLCLVVAFCVSEGYSASLRFKRQLVPREFQNINIENYLKVSWTEYYFFSSITVFMDIHTYAIGTEIQSHVFGRNFPARLLHWETHNIFFLDFSLFPCLVLNFFIPTTIILRYIFSLALVHVVSSLSLNFFCSNNSISDISNAFQIGLENSCVHKRGKLV